MLCGFLKKTHTELSISQHFYWKNLKKNIHKVCTTYKAYQFLERNKKLYGKHSPREAKTKLWHTLCVDLIDNYQFTTKGGGKKFQITPQGIWKKFQMTIKSGNSVYLQAITMVDTATG